MAELEMNKATWTPIKLAKTKYLLLHVFYKSNLKSRLNISGFMKRQPSVLSLTWQLPDIVPLGDQIWKHQRTWAVIHISARSDAARNLTRCNICSSVQSPHKDISWTVIWDYSQTQRQDEQGLLSARVISVRQKHGMITPRVLSSFSPTVCGADML